MEVQNGMDTCSDVGGYWPSAQSGYGQVCWPVVLMVCVDRRAQSRAAADPLFYL